MVLNYRILAPIVLLFTIVGVFALARLERASSSGSRAPASAGTGSDVQPSRATPKQPSLATARPGDVLAVKIVGLMQSEPEVTFRVPVDDDGSIGVAAAGRVMVRGMTCDGIARAIVVAAEKHRYQIGASVIFERRAEQPSGPN